MPTKKTAPSSAELQELLQAGAHFGQRTQRWNPKMAPYIFAARGGVHIIDLIQTADRLQVALKYIEEQTANGKTILFVSTKRQAKTIVADAAKRSGMPYVTYRWLGGMLTNWNTISTRIRHLKQLETGREDGSWDKLTKKEKLLRDVKITKLSKVFDGVRDLEKAPDLMFIVDVPREEIAIQEAHTLKIPIIAMVDTNANPDGIDFPIPANDDAIKSIHLIVNKIADAASAGHAQYVAKTPTKEELDESKTNADEK